MIIYSLPRVRTCRLCPINQLWHTLPAIISQEGRELPHTPILGAIGVDLLDLIEPSLLFVVHGSYLLRHMLIRSQQEEVDGAPYRRYVAPAAPH